MPCQTCTVVWSINATRIQGRLQLRRPVSKTFSTNNATRLLQPAHFASMVHAQQLQHTQQLRVQKSTCSKAGHAKIEHAA
jgi:hypothetical protein